MKFIKDTTRFFLVVFFASLVLVFSLDSGLAQSAEENTKSDDSTGLSAEDLVHIPPLWRIESRLLLPKFANLKEIRFLTENDYPPFSFVDENNELVGFNVEIARLICIELELECTIRADAWDTLIPSLTSGDGDAVVASISITEKNRELVDFSDRYYLTPARFVSYRNTEAEEITPDFLKDKRIAVIGKTAHEAFLRDFFPQSVIKTFENREAARLALLDREVDFLFDDGISLVFWINGSNSKNCCEFKGGAYKEPKYFGNGVGIAIGKGRTELRTAINFALRKIYQKGLYEEIFLRYFPISFY